MADIKEKTLSEVKQRLEKSMSRLDKALMNKAQKFDELKALDKRKEEVEALEFNLITESKKKNQATDVALKSKDEMIEKLQKALVDSEKKIAELASTLKGVRDNTGADAGKVTALERENEILRNMLEDEKKAHQNISKVSAKVSEQLDLLISEVDKVLTDKIV